MYPTIYHAVLDLFGLDWPWLKMLNSFGFFVALAFVTASYLLTAELKRKAAQGLFKPQLLKVLTGQPPQITDIAVHGALGFLVGWKLIYVFMNAGGSSPQALLFSAKGNFILGVLLAVGFAAWRYWDQKRLQLPEIKETMESVYPHHYTGNITMMAALFGLLGAKLFHLLENPSEPIDFFTRPSFANFISGLTVYGGLIVGSMGVLVYAYRKGIALLPLCDAAAPGMILAYGIGRIGCQVSGDGDWGIANSSPKPDWLSWMPDWLWSYDYPNNVNYDVAEKYYLGPLNDTNLLPIEPGQGVIFEGYGTHLVPGVFPTPIYETLIAILIFLVLWSLRKRIQIPGVVFAMYLVMNGVERFFIEKIRVNNRFDLLGVQATQAEIIALLFILTGAVGLCWLTKRNRLTKNIGVEE